MWIIEIIIIVLLAITVITLATAYSNKVAQYNNYVKDCYNANIKAQADYLNYEWTIESLELQLSKYKQWRYYAVNRINRLEQEVFKLTWDKKIFRWRKLNK